MLGLNLSLTRQYAGVFGPGIIYTVQPSFDPTKLIVNKQVGLAYQAGTYGHDTPGVVVTESTKTYTVNGVSQTGTYVLQVGDIIARATVVLLIDGVDLGNTATTGDVTVPPLSITTSVAPSFDAAVLIVGNTVASAYLGGTYTSPSGTVTENTSGILFYNSDDILTDGSHTIDSSDISFYGLVPLLVDGNATGQYGVIASFPVTNTAPVAGDVTSNLIVPPGTAPSETAPAQMSAPTLASTATRITVTLAADPDDGGSAITSYDLRYSINAGSSWTTVSAISTGEIITGLIPGATGQLVQTRANNAIGAGSWSTSASVDMKVITFVGYATNNAGTGATIDVDLTTLLAIGGGAGGTIAEGDLVITMNGIDAASNLNVGPSGWTEIFELYSSTTRRIDFGADYKFMGSTPDTSVTMVGTNSAGGRGGAATCLVYRYVDPSSPFDETTTTATGTATDVADAPSITPVSTGALILALLGASRPAGNGALGTAPSGMTGIIGVFGNGSSRATWQMAAHKTDWTSGAFDPPVVTGTVANASDAWAAGTIALKPY